MENKEQTEQVRSVREQRKSTYKKIVRWMWGLAILGIVSVALLFFVLSLTDLPSFEELENPQTNLASEVYASDSEVLGRYYVENRVPVQYEDLSPNLVNAFVATEDERYYKHSGIDGEGLGRVFFKTFLLGKKSAGGASTITQQLAKMLFTDKPGSGLERVVQKLKEWIIAVKLERAYTKEEIMAMYLNKFNFINGAYGIKAASEIYFGKTQDSLRVEEAAVLVGMLKNPSLYNPMRRPEKVKLRREVVLKQMQKNEIIDQVEYDSLRNLPFDMSRFNRKTHTDGLAPYFRMRLGEEIKKILAKQENYRSDGSRYDIYRDGLRIYTTLDPAIQAHAEAAVLDHMPRLQERFWRVWKNKDPWTYDDPTKEKDEQEAIDASRKRQLKKLVRGTDRYKNLRDRYLVPTIETISADIDGFDLRDHDIERILEEENQKGYMTKLVSKRIIGKLLADKYKTAMKSEHWNALKTQWKALQKATQKEFEQPVKMKVFAYNDQMEKDTTMSPLDSIKYHRMFLQIGSVAVDPVTGHVKSWVGGINHKYFQFDHVTTDRQVGSTFKPFIYATAIAQQGISPCFEVMDLPYTIHRGEGNFTLLEDWTPNNANGEYSGKPFSLFKGLQYSKNTVSVFLMKQLGDTEPVRNLVDNMGLDKNKKRSNGTYRIPRAPSICLGSSDLTVMELTGAYTTFANNGMHSKPIFITRIEDKDGRTIYQEIPEERVALHPNSNFVMVEMLRKVMRQGLPGFHKIKSDLGGKTGTTNDYVDGWFMGLTPSLVVGTWVGGDDRWIRFLSLRDGIGAKMARPYFASFIRRLEEDESINYDKKARFTRPPGDIGIVTDCKSYAYDRPTSRPDGSDFPLEDEDESFGDDIFGDEQPTSKPEPEEEENEEFSGGF